MCKKVAIKIKVGDVIRSPYFEKYSFSDEFVVEEVKKISPVEFWEVPYWRVVARRINHIGLGGERRYDPLGHPVEFTLPHGITAIPEAGEMSHSQISIVGKMQRKVIFV